MAAVLERADIRQMEHVIQADPLPDRYARGWHCLGLADNFKDGKPHGMNIFGTRVVIFQGEDAQIRVLKAWCPHMGADLALGEIHGNNVACRFHNWEFGGDGQCKNIPYSKRIPPKARVTSWPVAESSRLLFVWNDPEGLPPPADMPAPRIAEADEADWSDWSMAEWKINNNCRELVDNLSDLAHFGPVHGSSSVKYFANIFEGQQATQVMVGINERLGGEVNYLVTRATYFGPASLICQMTGEAEGMPVNSILFAAHVPIDQDHFDLRFGILVKKNPQLSEEQNAAMAQSYVELTNNAFAEDVAIWHNKVRVDNPLLADGDGPITQLRNWYEQFYTDRALVPEKLTKRRVVEIDLGIEAQLKPELGHVYEV